MALIETIGQIARDPLIPGQVQWIFPNVYLYWSDDELRKFPRIASPWFKLEGIEFRLALFPSSSYFHLFLWRNYNVSHSLSSNNPFFASLRLGEFEREIRDDIGIHNIFKLPFFEINLTRVSPNGMCKLILTARVIGPATICVDVATKSECETNSSQDLAVKDNENTDESKIGGVDRLVQNLKNILLEGRNSDVKLKVGDREFPAHRGILGGRSPVFDSMFRHDMAEKNSDAVDIPDCSPEAFEALLLYLYTGSADTLSDNNVSDVYYAADKYQVCDLKKDCAEHMERNLSLDNFCDVMALSLRHSEAELKEAAIRFFRDNLRTIIKTVKWQKYVQEYPLHANELYIKALNA